MERLLGFDSQLLFDNFVTAISIFILFFALSYLLFNPVKKILADRRNKIAGELEHAAKSQTEAEELKSQYEAKLKNVQKEADEILEAARKKAKAQEAETLEAARAEAARIIERANREIELERKKTVHDLKQEVVSIAALMAEKAVTASMNVDIQNALIEETLKEMGESTWQS